MRPGIGNQPYLGCERLSSSKHMKTVEVAVAQTQSPKGDGPRGTRKLPHWDHVDLVNRKSKLLATIKPDLGKQSQGH
jgi:hypothetical protein